MRKEGKMADSKKKLIFSFINEEIANMSADVSAKKAEKAVWRHALGKPVCEDVSAWGLLQRDLPGELKREFGEPSPEERAIYFALCAYAAYGKHAEKITFGRTAAALGERQRDRVTRLENSVDFEAMCRNMKDILRLIVSKNGEGIDYGYLACDLYDWQYNRLRVARRWERDYYRMYEKEDQA